MIKFVCQQERGRIQHDFVLAVVNAIDGLKWLYGADCSYDYVLVEDIVNLHIEGRKEDLVPVGSIEFVHNFYKTYWGIANLRPYNIPQELYPYCKRKVWVGTEQEERNVELFCKSNTTLKKYTDIVKPDWVLPKDEYMFSELIDIDSEWRCFVQQGELKSIAVYTGGYMWKRPDIFVIKEMIRKFNKLDAYTLDVGVNKKGTFPIEIHDFYSCGLYGFEDGKTILRMLILSHKQKIKGIN